MLDQLPRYYNWQFAFLSAFHSRFERPLDVEKWWSLSVTDAKGRDSAQAWTPDESWQKLSQAIRSPMQVRTRTNEPPLQVEVTLQKVIREWDPVRQIQALNNTLRELELLRLRIAQEYVGLVQDYSQAVETYLQQLDRSPSALLFTRRPARRRVVEAAVQQLDALDARREAMRPAPKPATPNPSPPSLLLRRRAHGHFLQPSRLGFPSALGPSAFGLIGALVLKPSKKPPLFSRPASPGTPSPPRTSPGTVHLRSAKRASPCRESVYKCPPAPAN